MGITIHPIGDKVDTCTPAEKGHMMTTLVAESKPSQADQAGVPGANPKVWARE